MIESFNYDPAENLNDTFELTNQARNYNGGLGLALNSAETAAGKPKSATVWLDDDAFGAGWFFDSTPLDDAEFTGLI